MEIDRATTSRLRVDVDLPRLPERIGLHEVPLVVHVKTVFGCVFLEVCDESWNVDGHRVRAYCYPRR